MWSFGLRVELWTEGGVLDRGWSFGKRVEFWNKRGFRGYGWSLGIRDGEAGCRLGMIIEQLSSDQFHF